MVCGTESWLTPDISNSEIIPLDLGYTMFRQDRTGNIGGGVLILVKNDITASEQKSIPKRLRDILGQDRTGTY